MGITGVFPVFDEAVSLAHQAWATWRIVTEETSAELASVNHPYRAPLSAAGGKSIAVNVPKKPASNLSSRRGGNRRPECPDTGQQAVHHPEWSTDAAFYRLGDISGEGGTFDPSIATLMDFRCDQSRGIHFIYVLPFSE